MVRTLALAALCASPAVFADSIPADDSYPELRTTRDASLQRALAAAARQLGLDAAIASGRLAVSLVDIGDTWRPRMAGLNDGAMLYSASLPKIAILFGAFARIEEGTLKLDRALRLELEAMIRKSSNSAASNVLAKVGPAYLAAQLKKVGLYNVADGGGLWVGKPYGPGPAFQRDPLHNLSHGATAYQVSRFYYMMATGQLVSARASRAMMDIMSQPAIPHKFVKAIKTAFPQANLYRKSGTWRDYHCDSAIVEHDGKRYIVVGLSHDPQGETWLQRLALAVDALIPAVVARAQ